MPANRSRNARGQSRTFSSNQGHSVQPFGSNDNRALLVSQGPLMTNHLQLDELDLELALLKRKREMIEKQANMLVSDSRYGGSVVPLDVYNIADEMEAERQRLEDLAPKKKRASELLREAQAQQPAA